MTTAVKREKLTEYFRYADAKKIKAIYTLLENAIDKSLTKDELKGRIQRSSKKFISK